MNGHCNSFCSTVALDLSLGILLYITEFILFTFRSKGRHNCFSDYLFPKKNQQTIPAVFIAFLLRIGVQYDIN